MASQFITIEAFGVKEVQNALVGIRDSVKRRILKSALAFAIKPLAPAARALAPMQFGALKKSIGARVKQYKEVAVALIGPRTGFRQTVKAPAPFIGERPKVLNPAKTAHLVEHGTAPHFIPAPGYGKRAAKKSGKSVGNAPGWMHPGAKAHPFLAPAARAQTPNVIQRFRDHAIKRIDIEFNRAIAKGKRFWSTDV